MRFTSIINEEVSLPIPLCPATISKSPKGPCEKFGGSLRVSFPKTPSAALTRATRVEYPPKSERFICRSRNHGLPIRAQGQMQDTRCMSLQLSHSDQRRVLPDCQLVLREPVACDQFLVMWRPLYRTDLRLCVNGVQARPVRSVPKSQMAVGGASTCGEGVCLPWTPCKRLHSSSVMVELEGWIPSFPSMLVVPDANQVVIPSGRQLRSTGAPFQTTNLLRVGSKGGDVVICNSDIMVMDAAVARP